MADETGRERVLFAFELYDSQPPIVDAETAEDF